MGTISADEGAGHEAPPLPLAAPALMYGLDTADPHVFSTVVVSQDQVEPSDTLKPTDVLLGHDGGLPPPAPFYRSRRCMAMACCCCCSSCVVLVGMTLGIALPIIALLSTAQVPGPPGTGLPFSRDGGDDTSVSSVEGRVVCERNREPRKTPPAGGSQSVIMLVLSSTNSLHRTGRLARGILSTLQITQVQVSSQSPTNNLRFRWHLHES